MLTDKHTEYTSTDLWNKRIDQLCKEELGDNPTVEDEYIFRQGFFAGLSEAKKMFSSAQFSKKTKQIVRYGKEWRFKS